MPDPQSISHLTLLLLVVVGMTVPAAALSTSPNSAEVGDPGFGSAATAAQHNSSVNVTVGQQLSTVISVSSDEVQTEFQNTAFEFSVEDANEESQAETIAKRGEELQERAEAIREDYEDATERYESGEISKSQYAHRIANLNARAKNLLASYEQLSKRAGNVSGLELEAAGANLSSLDAAVENLSSVTGPGSSALLEQYLGEADGKIELETSGGLKIEIEREDGESSREFKRARDHDMNITVSHADALQTARDALSTPDSGQWVLTESKVKPHEGAIEFEFALAGSDTLTGEAEVRVDGSTGEIFRLEQETESRGDENEDDRDENEDDSDEPEGEDDEHDELTLLVLEGTPEPNATITLQVLADGEPADNVTLYLNDHEVGTTDANGTIAVTLPTSGEAELEAETGEAEGELTFEFGDEHDADEVFRKLNVAARLDGETVTVEVRFDGSAVRNATIYANDERVGSTGGTDAVTFTIDTNESDELELEIVKGAFEAELTYALHDGSLVLIEEEHDGDGDKADAEKEEDERDEDEPDEDEVDDDEDLELSMHVIEGTPEPNATITIEVRADGDSVENATVSMDGDVVGTTDANGTLTVTLPADEEAELRVEYGDADARLEFDFESDVDEDDDGDQEDEDDDDSETETDDEES